MKLTKVFKLWVLNSVNHHFFVFYNSKQFSGILNDVFVENGEGGKDVATIIGCSNDLISRYELGEK